MQETKEHIKSRMLKNVARLWGYTDTEAETNFDPLVSMLLTACATELEKISGEIHASRARVMERLVQLLSPDTLTGAIPAHSVAGALPVEPQAEINPDMQFYTRLKQGVSNETQEAVTKDIFFSPTDHFHLNRASIKVIAAGKQLSKINGNQKEVIAFSHGSLPASTMWLGIDEPGLKLDNTMFYFDFRNETHRFLFYHQLPKAKWSYNGMQLTSIPGYGQREICGETLNIESIDANEAHLLKKIKNQVNSFYKAYFITLLDESGLTLQKDLGHVPIFDVFKGKEVDLIQEQSLRWVKIQFPETIPNVMLQELSCHMNCFPVMNRKLHEVNYRLQDHINVIPLRSDDVFLDLEEVKTDENKPLTIHSYSPDDKGFSAMLMRNGGIGRFDERDAAAMIEFLLQLLRDESAAFSILDNDFVNGEIKNLQQVMNKLEQRVDSKQIHRKSTPYLVIYDNQKQFKPNLFIKYSSTNGRQANHIKSGTRLLPYNGSSFISNSIFMVSPTRGGRDRLTATENVLAYKSALLSKDRLITAEDIKAFCHCQLGNRLKRVSVQQGMRIHPDEQQGYMKTVEVVICLNEEAHKNMIQNGELNYWEENMTLLLQEKSKAWMPYHVILKSAV